MSKHKAHLENLGNQNKHKKTRSVGKSTPDTHFPEKYLTLEPRLLSVNEIDEALCHLNGWCLQEKKLHRQYQFSSFEKALGFLSGLALVAQKVEHPLEESEIYNRVTVDLTSPDAGGVTEIDVALAKEADMLADALK